MNAEIQVAPGDRWQHKNGGVYTVLYVTNTAVVREGHAPDVVYRGENGNVWSRPLSDWARSFALIDSGVAAAGGGEATFATPDDIALQMGPDDVPEMLICGAKVARFPKGSWGDVAGALASFGGYSAPPAAGEFVAVPREPTWIVNDIGELGVMVDGIPYFLYKGDNIVYHDAVHDDGSPMRYRIVGKREFGEVCHPLKWILAGRAESRYSEELVYTPGLSFGKPEDGEWRQLPMASRAAPNAAAQANDVDGWERMTQVARAIQMQHLDNHTGDVYHAMQSLVVEHGWRGHRPMTQPIVAAQAGDGGK